MSNLYFIDAPLDTAFPLDKKDSHNTNTISSQAPSPPPTTPVSKDPLVASGWENFVYGAVFLMAIAIIIIVGVFSKRVEHAIAISLLLSAIAFVFLFAH